VAENEGISSIEQLEPEAILQVDLRYCADAIENVCGELLLPPPAGIYHALRLDPVIVPGKQYFVHDDKGMPVLLDDINDIESDVFDGAGNCVITARDMKNKKVFLSATPLLPYRGLLIVKDMVDYHLNHFSAYRKANGKTLFDCVRKHLSLVDNPVPLHHEENETQREKRVDLQVQRDETVMNLIEACFRPVGTELTLFLGEKRWNIFFARVIGATLRVERCMDWRAWEWEQKHGNDFRAGRYA
jgi:hypothetical protein